MKYLSWCSGLSLLMLVGCASVIEKKTQEDQQKVQTRVQEAADQLYAAQRRNPLVKLEQVPRFTGKSVAYQPSQMLPPHIGKVTMRVPGVHSLKTVASLIERMIEIPITLSEDALLPASEFAPLALQQGAGAIAGSGKTNTTINSGVAAGTAALSEEAELTKKVAKAVKKAGGPRAWVAADGAGNEMELNYQGSLAGLLDHVALHMGVKWRYSEGKIHFYRIVSRTFIVKTMPATAGAGGAEGNVLGGVEKNINLMLSRFGRINIDQGMSTITVHDANANIERIDRYIDSLNRQLSRQVALQVEVLQITLNNDHQTGIDWNWIVGTKGGSAFQISSPPSLTTDAASIGFVSANNDNKWLIRALEKFGRVSSTYASVITTMNRQLVPLGSQTTQSYLKQIGMTVGTSANGAAITGPATLTPGEITTGFNMTLLPIVLDSNHVLMHCTINISTLKDLASFSSGVGSAQQTIQQPNVSTFNTQQRMTVKSGETIVLSGYENETTISKQNDVVRNVLPGGRANSRDKTTLVVLITPKLLDI